MSSLSYQYEATGIYTAIFEKTWSEKGNAGNGFDYYGDQLEKGRITSSDLVKKFLESSDGRAIYSGMSDTAVFSKIYANAYGNNPDQATIDHYMANGLYDGLSGALTDLMEYSGPNLQLLNSYQTFDETIKDSLYPVVISDSNDQTVAAIYYSLGRILDETGSPYWSAQLDSGKSAVDVADGILASNKKIAALNNSDFVNAVFDNLYQRSPTASELDHYLTEISSGTHRGQVMLDMIQSVMASSDAEAKATLEQAMALDTDGVIVDTVNREETASVYLAVPNRDIDANGLHYWGKYDAVFGFDDLVGKIIYTDEFNKKATNKPLNEYIAQVYQAVYGKQPSAEELAHYASIGDKAKITTEIIDSLRTSTSHDQNIVIQKHLFEKDIAQSLNYAQSAKIGVVNDVLQSDINDVKVHNLTSAELTTLQSIYLTIAQQQNAKLDYADSLNYLTVDSKDTVNLVYGDAGVPDVSADTANVFFNSPFVDGREVNFDVLSSSLKITLSSMGVDYDSFSAGKINLSTDDGRNANVSKLTIDSIGSDRGANSIALTGHNEKIGRIDVAGDKQINLSVTDEFTHLSKIDLTKTTDGVSLTYDISQSDQFGLSKILYSLLQSEAPDRAAEVYIGSLGQTPSGQDHEILGARAGASEINIGGNVEYTANKGSVSSVNIIESNLNRGVTINNFDDNAANTLTLEKSGISISLDKTQGTAVDTQSVSFSQFETNVDNVLNHFYPHDETGLIKLFNDLTQIGKFSFDETSKVGAVSFQNSSLVFVDDNGNKQFDSTDTLVFLNGVGRSDHLYYSQAAGSDIQLVGVSDAHQDALALA
jgi:hypothetical protein